MLLLPAFCATPRQDAQYFPVNIITVVTDAALEGGREEPRKGRRPRAVLLSPFQMATEPSSELAEKAFSARAARARARVVKMTRESFRDWQKGNAMGGGAAAGALLGSVRKSLRAILATQDEPFWPPPRRHSTTRYSYVCIQGCSCTLSLRALPFPFSTAESTCGSFWATSSPPPWPASNLPMLPLISARFTRPHRIPTPTNEIEYLCKKQSS